ncbi:MAG: hypothetical protein R2787_08115 [Saprospiraceae bacterium]
MTIFMASCYDLHGQDLQIKLVDENQNPLRHFVSENLNYLTAKRTDNKGLISLKKSNKLITIHSWNKRDVKVILGKVIQNNLELVKLDFTLQRRPENNGRVNGTLFYKKNKAEGFKIYYRNTNNEEKVYTIGKDGTFDINIFEDSLKRMMTIMPPEAGDTDVLNGPTITLSGGSSDTRMDVYLDNIKDTGTSSDKTSEGKQRSNGTSLRGRPGAM